MEIFFFPEESEKEIKAIGSREKCPYSSLHQSLDITNLDLKPRSLHLDFTVLVLEVCYIEISRFVQTLL